MAVTLESVARATMTTVVPPRSLSTTVHLPLKVNFSELGEWLIVAKPIVPGVAGVNQATLQTWRVPVNACRPREPGVLTPELPQWACPQLCEVERWVGWLFSNCTDSLADRVRQVAVFGPGGIEGGQGRTQGAARG